MVFYNCVVIPALPKIRNGTLGEDPQGRPVKLPHAEALQVVLITVLGGSLFTSTMKFLLDAFVCDYNEEVIRFVLIILANSGVTSPSKLNT